jgi:hypothetical protein
MRSFAFLLFLLLGSCIYEAPLTESPTRKIDDRLIGDWVSAEEKPSVIQIRKFDDSNFILIDGGNVYRVFHSDFEGVHFLSLQNLETNGSSARKFAFLDYRFEQPNRVRARAVNKDVVPETLRTTPELQKSVRDHLKDPQLFNKDEIVYTRKTEGYRHSN